jgi:hypothetical protein
MNDSLTDNYPMWVIYGIHSNTAETGRWYVSAPTAESALVIFWVINARDYNTAKYEWIVETLVESEETNPS